MSNRHYYAWDNSYNIGARHDGDNKRMGVLHIFNSKKARDQWVADEHFDGSDWHREAVTAAEARFDLSYELKHAAEELPAFTHIDYGETLTLSDLTKENSKYDPMDFYAIHCLQHCASPDPVKEELHTRRETARALISSQEYMIAERIYDGDIWNIAEDLGVTPSLIKDWQKLCLSA